MCVCVCSYVYFRALSALSWLCFSIYSVFVPTYLFVVLGSFFFRFCFEAPCLSYDVPRATAAQVKGTDSSLVRNGILHPISVAFGRETPHRTYRGFRSVTPPRTRLIIVQLFMRKYILWKKLTEIFPTKVCCQMKIFEQFWTATSSFGDSMRPNSRQEGMFFLLKLVQVRYHVPIYIVFASDLNRMCEREAHCIETHCFEFDQLCIISCCRYALRMAF